MSYILDALKKSEAERAAQASARPAPELGPAQALSSGSRNRSLIPLLVVLVFMLFGLSAYLLMSSARQPGALPEPVVAPEIPQVRLVAEKASTPVVVMEETVLPDSNAPVTVTAPDSANKSGNAAPLDALRRIPDLDISGHLFSSVAEKRSVTMNGRDWREGDQIAEGIVLSEITQDGIRLTVDGWPVIVGRSRGWKAIR